ncbi:MAG: hypothetical protein IT328_05345 [Caldilineaceae bacterium]|nr:hypothetical protein [Caldilineaceae bacterium]
MVTPATPRIDWRKLLLPFLFIMVLPSVLAILADFWLGSLPFITIAAIVLCFPTATILVMKTALREMDRVIAEVAPPVPEEAALPETGLPESEVAAESS